MAKKMKPSEVTLLLSKHPHLREHVSEFSRKYGRPEFYKELDRSMAAISDPNIIYQIDEDVFVHVYRDKETGELIYYLIEPKVEVPEIYEKVLNKITELAADVKAHEPSPELLRELAKKAFEELRLNKKHFEAVYFNLVKNIVGYEKWDSFFKDVYLEDVRNAGTITYVVHKVWGNMRSNVEFEDLEEVDGFAFRLGLRMNKRVSITNPIVDGILPENRSRVNIIYGTEVSKEGTAISIRLVEKEPMSVISIMDLGTASAELMAYLWLAIENGMSVFFCGPTASGKTTTMRATSAFIKPDAKIYSVEDTPELYVPHKNWQATVAKEGRADMFDLLKASLRSRPDYIIVGEIRGKEGNIAFQAMQTGHPVMSTFHGGDIKKIIQRLNGPPINIPLPYLTNLNVVVIQRSFRRGRQIIRRVIAVYEIEGYQEGKGIMTRMVFRWDPLYDRIEFLGRYNSYILEKKIALYKGYADPRKIYEDLDERAAVLSEMQKRGIKRYMDVFNVIKRYYYFGLEGLPFPVVRE